MTAIERHKKHPLFTAVMREVVESAYWNGQEWCCGHCGAPYVGRKVFWCGHRTTCAWVRARAHLREVERTERA